VLADDMNLPHGWVADGSTISLIREWITGHLRYEPVSSVDTNATDTYVARAGVCRDFAHLMIALARAAGVPARFVSSYAWQLDPPDFHAVAELWIAGQWRLIDATRLVPEQTLVRIARTRDAIDASFMTIFGSAQMRSQTVQVTRA
jgi:transglutaminase-like putative cysteine protease